MPEAPPKHVRKSIGRVHQGARRQRDRRRGTANSRGYTYKWQKASKAFLAEPENAFCACGCGALSQLVDHIVPHRGDMDLFWDRSNWQGMTTACHNRKTAREDGGYGNSKGKA